MANLNRTFAELQAAVQVEMQLDPGLISAEERAQFINDALADVGDLGLFERTEEFDVEDGTVALPDDFVHAIAVMWEDGRALRPATVTMSDKVGTPVYFVQSYNSIRVFPKSDGKLLMVYSFRPAALVDDADQPDIPNGYDAMLVEYAVARAHRKNGNIGLYREYMASYETYKIRLAQELVRRINSRVTPTVNQQAVAVDPHDVFRYM